MTKYYVDSNGNYVGGFDGALPPAGSIQVPSPPDTHASQTWNGSSWSAYQPPVTPKLEAAFMQMLPKHLGQSYCNGAVITTIMQAKVAVVDANNIDATGDLARLIISSLSLPSEMENDRQALLGILP